MVLDIGKQGQYEMLVSGTLRPEGRIKGVFVGEGTISTGYWSIQAPTPNIPVAVRMSVDLKPADH